jgi:subtilisin family serine protease
MLLHRTAVVDTDAYLLFSNNATDRWIEDFRNLLQKVEQHNPHEVVKVALLDTGIDINHIDFEGEYQVGRIKSIRSWVDDNKGKELPMDGDESGHGTFISSLLLDLAPNIHLYVARITKTRRVKGRSGDFDHIASVSHPSSLLSHKYLVLLNPSGS